MDDYIGTDDRLDSYVIHVADRFEGRGRMFDGQIFASMLNDIQTHSNKCYASNWPSALTRWNQKNRLRFGGSLQ